MKKDKPTNSAVKLRSNPTSQQTGKIRKDSYYANIAPKSISQARNDIATWKTAIRQATAIESPKRIKLQNLYKDIMLDALLSSQVENRKRLTIGSKFTLKDKSGNANEEATAFLSSMRVYNSILSHVLDSVFYGHTVVEILNDQLGLRAVTIPRNNVMPEAGVFVYDENDTKGVPIRETKEYGTWLLEFGDPTDLGLLNKTVPHVLFKRFAQSCWSELCEIYGIPPRVMKTNTQDPAMLSRGEQMMRDMGAAAWFIIDESENLDFATGTTTNGDVYNNLIRLCNNEISMVVSGAIIGQDTKNGNESKETISIEMLNKLVNSDKKMVESCFNTIVLPALFKIGVLPDGLKFEFDPQENIAELWNMTEKAMQYLNVDPDWVKTKFGIEVTGVKQTIQQQTLSFFD